MSAMGVMVAFYIYSDPFYAPPQVLLNLPPPPTPAQGLRVMTLNLAHGRATKFHQNLTRTPHIRTNLDAVAEMIRSAQVDIVALQELDAPSSWSGEFDHLQYLSQRTGLSHHFHGLHVQRDTPKLAYGTGILSRYPLHSLHSQAFDVNAFDTKGFVSVTASTPQGEIDLVSLHLDFKRDGERITQLDLLSESLRRQQSPRPLLVSGDFNTSLEDPSSPLHSFSRQHHLSHGDFPYAGTYPSHAPYKHIDYLLGSQDIHLLSQWVLPTSVSDHRAVVLDLSLHSQTPSEFLP